MFKIRREQKVAFREQALRDFEDRVVGHVERCFPERREVLGEGGVREVIRLGLERAAMHGIVAERDVCKFVDLMLVFGIDFDRRCAWAREVLGENADADPFVKMSRLFERAMEMEA